MILMASFSRESSTHQAIHLTMRRDGGSLADVPAQPKLRKPRRGEAVTLRPAKESGVRERSCVPRPRLPHHAQLAAAHRQGEPC